MPVLGMPFFVFTFQPSDLLRPIESTLPAEGCVFKSKSHTLQPELLFFNSRIGLKAETSCLKTYMGGDRHYSLAITDTAVIQPSALQCYCYSIIVLINRCPF